MDARTAVIASLARVAPEADVDDLADDVDLRDELDLDSMDFLNFVVGIHDRTGSRGSRTRLPADCSPSRLRDLPGGAWRGLEHPLTTKGGAMELLRWLNDIGRQDVALAGGKGANLGELRRAGFPVPDGFVVTAEAYLAAMARSGLRGTWRSKPRRSIRARWRPRASGCRPMVGSAPIPERLRAAVAQTPTASWLGGWPPHSSRGGSLVGDRRRPERHVVRRDAPYVDQHHEASMRCWPPSARAGSRCSVSGCWPTDWPRTSTTSLRSPWSCRRWCPSSRSGVAFTADPTTGDTATLVIEGAPGQGEVVVGGWSSPTPTRSAARRSRCSDVHIGVKACKVVASRSRRRRHR